MDLLNRPTDRVDIPGGNRNRVLAQKVQQASTPWIFATMLVDRVEAVAGNGAQECEKCVGRAVDIGQENKTGCQWPTVEVARGVHDEEAREVDAGQPGEWDEGIVGRNPT